MLFLLLLLLLLHLLVFTRHRLRSILLLVTHTYHRLHYGQLYRQRFVVRQWPVPGIVILLVLVGVVKRVEVEHVAWLVAVLIIVIVFILIKPVAIVAIIVPIAIIHASSLCITTACIAVFTTITTLTARSWRAQLLSALLPSLLILICAATSFDIAFALTITTTVAVLVMVFIRVISILIAILFFI